jgi:signal transduction histidine kinase
MNPQPTACEILIVEDSATQALLLQKTLEKNGFRVTAARDGRKALDALAKARPTLIISDIQMPEMDGFELCRTIKADRELKNIPVILLTSLSAPQDIISGLECGAENFVVKPYEEGFLLDRIAMVLANLDLRKTTTVEHGITIQFAGHRYVINADRRQILSLLLSTYETAVKTNLDLIQAHEELKAAQAQLIEAEKLQSVGRLAAGVAHEVRNPLAILEMGIGFLAGQEVSEDNKIILDEMNEAVRRANIVVTSLMDLSAQRDMGMREQSWNTVAEQALGAMAGDLERAGIEVQRDFGADIPDSPMDATKIEQVFMNLLTNALHAMPEGGTLTVRTRRKTLGEEDVKWLPGDRSGTRFREQDEVVVIELSDTGTGIAPENLDKLFDPFFSTKPTGKGMGLGLTVARKVVELHRGSIHIRNQPTGGAVVTMMFPASHDRIGV